MLHLHFPFCSVKDEASFEKKKANIIASLTQSLLDPACILLMEILYHC